MIALINRRALATAPVPPSVTAVGYVAGRRLWAPECCTLVSSACLAGTGLALVALCRRRSAPVEQAAGAALIAYVVLATAADPFARAGDRRHVALGLAWLMLVAIGAAALPRRGWWRAGAGYWALLLATTAALTYSSTHWSSGVGLFYAWLS
jgi:hypothetical protein